MDLLEKFLEASREKETISEISLNMYKKDITDFKNFLKDKEYEDILNTDIGNYIKFMETKYQENSIIRKISSIKIFYKFLLKKGIVEVSPAEDIVMSRKFVKSGEKIELNELRDILNSCGEDEKGRRDKIIIKLLSETGVQITDILNLRISQMENNDYKSFTIENGSEYIIVEISDESAVELKEYVTRYRNNIVKDSYDDKIFCDLSRQNFRARFMAYGKKAGIEREVLPSMIKNRCQYERKEYHHEKKNKPELIDKIREEYFRIGIGDD